MDGEWFVLIAIILANTQQNKDLNMDEKVTIQGVLSRIIFQGENGFLIGKLKNNKDLDTKLDTNFTIKTEEDYTIIGTIINPQINLEYKLTGKWVENAKYGKQFKIEYHETILPQDPNGIFKYIVRICKYVGPAIGNILVEKYGSKTIEVLKINPEKIALEIKGISFNKAKEIQKKLLENEKTEKIQVELGALLDIPGMRKNLINELLLKYKSNAPEKIKQNPYFLTEFHGIGFALADRVAILKVKLQKNHIERKKSAVIYALKQYMQEGNCWIEIKKLINLATELIQVDNIKNGIDILISENVLVQNCGAVAMKYVVENEKFVAESIINLVMGGDDHAN